VTFVYAGEQFTQDGSIVDTKIVIPRDQFDITYTLVPVGTTGMRLLSRSRM
jgi:hypothetical protein